MLVVSNNYKLKIDAPERRCVAKVEVYFNGPSAAPTVFEDDDISSFVLLEEARAESESPLGRVSANELSLNLDNASRYFTPSNEGSPYFGKLLPNLKIVPFIGLDVGHPHTESIEWIPLGVFWTGDWSAPSLSTEASVTCYDQLYRLGEIELPPFPVMRNTTIAEMLKRLFTVLGLSSSEYAIDPTLKQYVRMGWLPRGKAWSAFQELATAGSCTIVADRQGRIAAINNFRLTDSVATMDDVTQVFDMEIPQEYRNIFTSTTVSNRHPSLDKLTTVLNMENLEIPRGSNTFKSLEFSPGPIASLSQLSLRGAKTSYINRLSYGAWTADIRITNPGTPEIVSLYAEGIPIRVSESNVNRTDKPLATLYGVKEQVINSDLIQDISVAREYVSLAGNIGLDPNAYVQANIRGNPAVELLDTITLENPSDKFKEEEVVVLRSTISYDGALSGTIHGIRKESLIVKDWVFISPGLFSLVPRHFELR